MTIQDWGAIGEIVGGIGVILTLIYLATQIRQNSKLIASASLQGLSERVESRMMAAAVNSEFAEIIERWMSGEELNSVEIRRCSFWMSSWLSDLQDGYRQMKLGVVPEIVLKGRLHSMSRMMQSQHAEVFWQDVRVVLDPEFREWYEKEIDKVGTT